MEPMKKNQAFRNCGLVLIVLVAVWNLISNLPRHKFMNSSNRFEKSTDGVSGSTLFKFIPCEVFVPCISNVGNQFVSLLYGLHHAHIFKTVLSTLSGKCYEGYLGNGVVEKIFMNYSEINEVRDCDGYGLELHAWSDQKIILRPTPQQARSLALSLHDEIDFSKHLNSALRQQISSDDCLTIYLRSGDIFNSAEARLATYIQAPCKYFSYVLSHTTAKRVVVITSAKDGDAAHPCLKTIAAFHPRIEVSISITSVAESFWALIEARQLVLPGHSSFGFLPALLGMNRSLLIMPIFEGKNGELHSPDFRWLLPATMQPRVRIKRLLVQGFETVWSDLAIAKMHSDTVTVSPFDDKHMNGLYAFGESYTLVLHGLRYAVAEEIVHVCNSLRSYAEQFYHPEAHTWHLSGIVLPTCLSPHEITRTNHLFTNRLHGYLTAFLRLPDSACLDDIRSGTSGAKHSSASNLSSGTNDNIRAFATAATVFRTLSPTSSRSDLSSSYSSSGSRVGNDARLQIKDEDITAHVQLKLNPFRTTHTIAASYDVEAPFSKMMEGLEIRMKQFLMHND